ncbi:MAG: hypothetical protein H6Q59_1762 [Firmicutes bacterium]|nr:hypothetical protein [Bacillota bacterium]
MKKRLNIVFFGLCFLGAIIAEAYFVQAGAGNLFSIIAIGVVTLITGYLLMDSIRSKLTESGREIKNYLDQMYREDTERFTESITEVMNLQKATYTATKKNTATLSEQFDELLNRVEVLENNNTKSLQRLLELQKKALEGQKNALNLEINYNKENTKLLVKAMKQAGNQEEIKGLLNKILEQNEKGTEILQNELQNISITIQGPLTNNLYSEQEWELGSGAKVENLTESGWNVDAEVEVNDSNNSWNSDLDESIEKDPMEIEWDTVNEEQTSTGEQKYTEDQTFIEDNIMEEVAADVTDWNSDIDLELNNLIQGWDLNSTTEITPESSATQEEEQEPEVIEDKLGEAVEAIEAVEAVEPIEVMEESKSEIKPLYADPNKALSADEIAALFASFGQ